ncbi:uncharacterized protein [Physcomitrium patens]|uniref:PROP1-like PPR domain-containing protein n=1 Tax=Physcomitrium patens TaxID=3218 RepID=A0A2K1KI74_PHYPA|nr:pentatricopeptide repeat-containing protein At1g63400-like [Physcomitrium patens]PNR53481.1 hypothetical protein PHYPA_007156 [Physcomitrium patens]|eukprot:XP_024377080.1 pentatricopeptide repeat-containing protein At1g63400-like [Physcomitrella patens]
MQGRTLRNVQSFRQTLLWMCSFQERLWVVDCNVGARERQATVLLTGLGGQCIGGEGLAQLYRPWFRVCSERIGGLCDLNVVYKSTIASLGSRVSARVSFTTLVGDEDDSAEHCRGDDGDGGGGGGGLRGTNDHEKIASRFEKLLQKWSSNTPLFLNDLQVQLTPAIVCQVLKMIPKSDAARKFFKWATTQPGFQHDVYTYAALIDYYGKRQNFSAMDQVVAEMKEAGCPLSTVTFTSLVVWHSQVKKLTGTRRVWQQMLDSGIKPNEYIYSSYIDALVKGGCHEEAIMVFKEMQEAGCRPNIFTYSVVILSLVESMQLEAACELYERMTKLQYKPNSTAYSVLIRAHAKGPDMEKAIYFYREMIDSGLTPSQSLRSLLSEALTKQGRLNEAEELTQISAAMAGEKLKSKELEAVLHGSLPRPERLAELLRDWGPETELALERVKLKLRHPYLLNVLTLVSGEPEVAWRYFEWVRAQENYNPTRHMFTRILDIVGKTGHGALQKEIILEAEAQAGGNAVTYDKVIKSYCLSKHTDAALLVFERMKEQGIQPDANVYTTLIDVLSRTRGHTQAMEMYAEMVKAKCKPTVDTYTAILHSLARSGRVKAAITLFEKLPSFGVPPSIATYTILLKACLKADELETVLKLYAGMRRDGLTPSRAIHRMVTRGLHAAGMHDEADALSEVPVYFPDANRGVSYRTPRARKSMTSIVSSYYE